MATLAPANEDGYFGDLWPTIINHYSAQWVRFERDACADLRAASGAERQLAAITRIVGEFGIARNLRRAFDKDKGLARYGPLLDALNTVRSVGMDWDATSMVRDLHDRLFKVYKVSLISLCSKTLWFARGRPIVIYDLNARLSLGVKSGDYSTFYARWHAEYQRYRPAIVAALHNAPHDRFDAATRALAQEEWFLERVFDIALWRRGDYLKKKNSSGARDSLNTGIVPGTLFRSAQRISGTRSVSKLNSPKNVGVKMTAIKALERWAQLLRVIVVEKNLGWTIDGPIIGGIQGNAPYVRIDFSPPFAIRLVHRNEENSLRRVSINFNADTLQHTDRFRALSRTDPIKNAMLNGMRMDESTTPYFNLADFSHAADQVPDPDPAIYQDPNTDPGIQRVLAAIAFFEQLQVKATKLL